MKRILTIILLATVLLAPAELAHAASPFKVTGKEVQATSVVLYWAKVPGTSGYDVYVGKRHVTTARPKACVSGLAQKTSYGVVVKAYTNKRVRQFFNSKTRKWVNKKPAKRNWKGRKTRIARVKAYVAQTKTAIQTKEALNTATVKLISQSGPAAGVRATLTLTDGRKFRIVTGESGSAKVSLPAGRYEVTLQSNVYSLPGRMRLAITGRQTVNVRCREIPSYLDIIVQSDTQMSANVKITDAAGAVIRSENVALKEGYNYPADANVPKGEYTVTMTTADGTEEQRVSVEECGAVYSAFFEIKAEEGGGE